MTWFVLSLMTALAVASCDAGMKKWFSHLNSFEMTLLPLAYGVPPMAMCFLWIRTPPLGDDFWLYFIISVPLNMIPMLLYMKAIRTSPMSLTVPYLAFTPVFIIVTGHLFLNEQVNAWGFAGIIAVCLGGYVVNITGRDRTVFDPLLAVFRETGSWLMLIVAFIFSLSSVIGKKAILLSSPLFFQASFFIVLTLAMAAVFGLSGKIRARSLIQSPVKAGIVGLLMLIHLLCHGFAISMTKAAYMMSIKRLSIVFGVIYGGVIFKEENIGVRLAGAGLMFAGAGIILLMGN
jgi:drug/metabolite transporter (DMT)-like permease